MSVYRLSHTDTAILREHATTAKERIGVERDLYVCRDCGTEYQVSHVEPRLAERLEQARRARLVAGEREREGARDA